jgi:hypothetical protein
MTWIAAGVASGAATHAVVQYAVNKKNIKRDEANRPKYVVPPEVAQGLTLAEHQALEGLPEEQKQQYISNLQRGAAFSLSQNESRAGGLNNIAAINANQNQGYANLLSQDADARYQKQQNVFGQLQNVADYNGQEQQLNKFNPYYEHIAARNANNGALSQNLSKAAQTGGGAMGNKSGGGGQQQQYQPSTNNNIYGSNYYQNGFNSNSQSSPYNTNQVPISTNTDAPYPMSTTSPY